MTCLHFQRWYFYALVLFVMFGLLDSRPAWADVDVFLAAKDGRVVIGSGHDASPHEVDLSPRVFEGIMIADFLPVPPFGDYGHDEPGFFALPAGHPEMPPGVSALPAGAAVTINLSPFTVGGSIDSLFYWDGLGAVSFQPISMVQPDVSLTLLPNPIGSTGTNGGFDLHPVFRLDHSGAGVPADGVYLIGPTASVEGLADSERFYMVWLVDALIADEDAFEAVEQALEDGTFVALGKNFAFFDAAADYVFDHLVIPEPSGLVLAGLALVGIVPFARRRRTAQQSG